MTLSSHYIELEQRVKDLTSLIEVTALISSTLELDELIHLVMEKAQAVMHAEASSVMLLNKETQKLECRFALGEVSEQMEDVIQLDLGQGIAGWVAQKAEAVIVEDVNSDPRFFKNVDNETGFETRSILAAPLSVKGEVIGVAEVLNRQDGKPFTHENLELFITFCRQVALALENAKYHQYRLAQERFQQELASASSIQQSFMPQDFPQSPTNSFEIFGKNIPAAAVGGDLFDFIEIDDSHLAFVIGDVSGKGIPAALYMARLVSDLRHHSHIQSDAIATLTAINQLLNERRHKGMFVTLQYMILNTTTGELVIVNAGHLPPYWIHASSGEVEWFRPEGGIPLGVLKSAKFYQSTIQLKKNDTIVFFTDGVIEARNDKGQMYSLERLANLLEDASQHPDMVGRDIITDVLKFSLHEPQMDDITVVALKWCA